MKHDQGHTSALDIFDRRICQIGESPFFDDRTGRFLWVDLLAGRLLWRSLDGGDLGSLDVGAYLGAVVPVSGKGLILCLPDMVALREPDGTLVALSRLPSEVPGIRSNDAKADRAGRLWHGTMAHSETPAAGALYRLSPSPHPIPSVKILDGVTVSNGLGWSLDGGVMYYADSPTRRVDAFEVDLDTGDISERRPLITLPEGDGVPDGLCVDSDGCIWVACWNGSAVRRYTPEGTLDRIVSLPTPQVTSCAFGGADLDLLLITTAARDRAGDPSAGLTYVYRPGDVVGLPVDRYNLDT